ncbi:hypothetical protein NXS19_000423 [Fusarium pseudograminearum]|nr:hypothetical protein NXS19_000423 [Fusarium pseudograminearum]
MPQSALLLGSGFVATPAVEVLSKAGVHVTVACRTLASAKNLAGTFDNTKAVSLDVNDSAALEKAAAIKAKKNVVTTSYVSPAMEELHEEAKAAGITVLNEIGVDPGVDHLYAVDFIDRIQQEGGKIKSFKSYCGGLPAPENSNNP